MNLKPLEIDAEGVIDGEVQIDDQAMKEEVALEEEAPLTDGVVKIGGQAGVRSKMKD